MSKHYSVPGQSSATDAKITKLLKQVYSAPRLKSLVQKSKGRQLRIIIFPSGNGSFSFYVDWFFSLSPTRILLAIKVTRRVFYKKQETLSLREHLGSSSFLLLYCVLCLSHLSLFCALFPMLAFF
jgi:hypothetical protein